MYYPVDNVILHPLKDWSQQIMTCFLFIITENFSVLHSFLSSTALWKEDFALEFASD